MFEICDLPHFHIVITPAQNKASHGPAWPQICCIVEEDLEVLILWIPTVECYPGIIGMHQNAQFIW